MKKTKKIVALVVVMVMMLAVVATVLTACDNYNTLIWVSEVDGVAELTKKQIEEFNKTWEGEFKISARIEGIGEGEAATSVAQDVESAPDIFCFAQDQTARLQMAAALSAPGATAQAKIEAENDESALAASRVGGKIVCYPLTSDNGYFMMYDKRVITDSVDKTDLAALVKACEDAAVEVDGVKVPKKFAMETSTSAWYVASFFFATGCHSTWTTDVKGNFQSVDDDWNSDAGVIALRGMQTLVKSDAHVSSSDGDQFSQGAAIVVSGTWALDAAAKAIGADNLGYCELPYFTVDGHKYHMSSYMGNKLMGVKPQTDPAKAQAMHALAQYLTSKECQLQRFDEFGWGPSNLAAQAEQRVATNAPLVALRAQNEYAVTQGQIHGSWWDIGKVLGQVAYDAPLNDAAKLKEGLQKYEDDIQALFSMSDAEKRAWSVIGNVNKTNWDTDLEMVESPDNTWTSKDAIALDSNSIFKIRQGKGWDCQVGANNAFNDGSSGNITLAQFGLADGNYYVKVVFTVDADGKETDATVELIPA